ncbi:MAG TPA: type II toxin-antitoxin system VapC family toxin [Gemmatimonadota bacterium]|nr:type II toxin-antitoxin system VapC family toxin [Gemmatimonadota bacterium]
MTRVVDASVVVAALVDGGPTGRWAEGVLEQGPLVAPHLMPVEVANILRRAALAEEIDLDNAAVAHADLLDLRVELIPYAPVADRVWELRTNLTAYDAWYVATAEALGVPLATLDVRLAKAVGPRCRFLVPESGDGSEE